MKNLYVNQKVNFVLNGRPAAGKIVKIENDVCDITVPVRIACGKTMNAIVKGVTFDQIEERG